MKPLHVFLFLFLLTNAVLPTSYGRSLAKQAPAVLDEEYDAYRRKADDFFKSGRYTEARRQYFNCLEVPGFENDAYARRQIENCSTALALRQRADKLYQQGKQQNAFQLYGQLLMLNPDDASVKVLIADYYERLGSQLFNQNLLLKARDNYVEALKYATEIKKETLLIQIRAIDERLKPPKHIGLKISVGAVAIGAGLLAYGLHTNYQTKLSILNQISQTVDPENTNIVDTGEAYRRYNDARIAAEAAQQKNGLYKVCLGVAAVATLAELYVMVHKPRPRTTAWQWQPSSQSVGVAIRYTF